MFSRMDCKPAFRNPTSPDSAAGRTATGAGGGAPDGASFIQSPIRTGSAIAAHRTSRDSDRQDCGSRMDPGMRTRRRQPPERPSPVNRSTAFGDVVGRRGFCSPTSNSSCTAERLKCAGRGIATGYKVVKRAKPGTRALILTVGSLWIDAKGTSANRGACCDDAARVDIGYRRLAPKPAANLQPVFGIEGAAASTGIGVKFAASPTGGTPRNSANRTRLEIGGM